MKTPPYINPSVGILLLYLLLTILLTYPLSLNLSTTVPNDIGDPLLNTWILAWDNQILLTDPLNLFQANIFHPLPHTLAYSEIMFSTAMLIFPLHHYWGEPIVSYNLSLLLSFVLSAYGMYLLVLSWTHQRRAAFIAGLIFGFAPYRFAAIAHLQLLTFQWLPFIILALDLLNRPTKGKNTSTNMVEKNKHVGYLSRSNVYWIYRYGLLLICFTVLQLLASWYLAVYTLLIIAVYYGIFIGIQTVRFFQSKQSSSTIFASFNSHYPSFFALIISLLFLLPFILPYLTVLSDLRAARPLDVALTLAAQPTDYLAAAPFNRLFGSLTEPFRQRPDFTEENTLFLGIITPLLVLLALTRLVKPTMAIVSAIYTCHFERSLRRIHPKIAEWRLFNLRFQSDMTQTTTKEVPEFKTSQNHCDTLPSPSLPLLGGGAASPLAGGTEGGRDSAQFGRFIFLELPKTFQSSRIISDHTCRIFALLIILFSTVALTFALPYSLLATLFPPSTVIRVPPRWIIPALFAVAGLAGYGVKELPQFGRTGHGLFALVSIVVLLEAWSTPLRLAPVDNQAVLNPAYRWLAEQESRSEVVLLELPMYGYNSPEYPEVKRMYASTLGWWCLINGYSGFTPARQAELAQGMAGFPDSTAHQTIQTLAQQITLPIYLLVHPGESPFERSQWEEADRWIIERNPTLLPIGQFEGDYLYQHRPLSATPLRSPLVRFDRYIQLNHAFINTPQPAMQNSPTVILHWQTNAPLIHDYTVFVHFRAKDGFVLAQADSPPVSGYYSTTQWQPNEIIQDIHLIPLLEYDHVAIGLYDPTTGERLPAYDDAGQRLSDDAWILQPH
ncbi:hypothetical protein QUF63_01605 [Anaerolineales bacterium HSG25]|nr:hypothetical protein [Anaerolineales bacterium HSG25]